ncbi:neuroglian-like [Gigantopelta aegis]|uniref:neuroglian-like n=1 Tax=Gigantopelta aegis TaxID=1735272 RepID=UPI001B8885B4|nr:neuroglian-like [Gigantopelta aegis]XP_041350237.1 neuroglian-like [Gigantopelta aegis]
MRNVFGFLIFWCWILIPLAIGLVYIEDQLRNLVVDEGERARFVCKTATHPQDEPKLKLDWLHDGKAIEFRQSDKYVYKKDRSKHILIIRNTDMDDAGLYTCTATVDIDMDMSSAHLTVRGAPDPPAEVQVISCHGHSAELVWQPGRSNGEKISRFVVQFNTSEDTEVWHDYFEEIRGGEHTAFIDLPPWGTYAFRVLAKNKVGLSKPSAVTRKMCTPPPDRPDGNPKNVRTRTDEKGKLVVEWTPMHRLYHHGPGFRYHVYWRPRSSTYWNSAVVTDPRSSFYEVEVDDVYQPYEVLVKAENDLGESHQPAFVFLGYSGESEPRVVPNDFRLDPSHPVEPHSAHFIWESIDTMDDKINGMFKGYKLKYWKSSEGRYKMKEVDIDMVSQRGVQDPDVRVSVLDLPAYTALRAQVAVMNQHYTGPPSQTIDFFTPEGVPGPIRRLHTEAHGPDHVLLRWLPPEVPNGILVGYNIGYQEVINKTVGPLTPISPQIDSPSTLGARITGLDPGRRYRFYVSARTKAGQGSAEFIDITTETKKRLTRKKTSGKGKKLHDTSSVESSTAKTKHNNNNLVLCASLTLLVLPLICR